jgi:hypothetical protein
MRSAAPSAASRRLDRCHARADFYAPCPHIQLCVAQGRTKGTAAVYARADECQCGALIELGAALAAGKHVFLVGPYDWTIAHHPRCRTFPSLEAAIAAIVAMQAGERERLRRVA